MAKLAELSYIESEAQGKPTLLLDDIFSELDHEHRDVVMGVVKGQRGPALNGAGRSPVSHGTGQTIITTADPHFIESLKKVEKIKL